MSESFFAPYEADIFYWGNQRTVIVTYTPATARKQAYTFDDKLEAIHSKLLSMRAKVKDTAPHWRKADAFQASLDRLTEVCPVKDFHRETSWVICCDSKAAARRLPQRCLECE